MRYGILMVSLLLAAGPALADDPVHQGKKLSEWIKQLQDDKDAEARGEAAHQIGVMGKTAKAAVPALAKALKDKDDDVRDWACYALANIGPDAKEALPALEDVLLNDKVKHVRRESAVAIGSLHDAGKAAVPSLRKTLKDPDPWMRHFSAVALGAIGEGAKDAVPDLVKAFGDDEYVVQKSSVEAVGEIGPSAKEAVPALIKVWKDRDEYTLLRNAAAASIKQIDPEAAKKAGVP
jgi:HEAT repeat protein